MSTSLEAQARHALPELPLNHKQDRYVNRNDEQADGVNICITHSSATIDDVLQSTMQIISYMTHRFCEKDVNTSLQSVSAVKNSTDTKHQDTAVRSACEFPKGTMILVNLF